MSGRCDGSHPHRLLPEHEASLAFRFTQG